MYSCFAWFGAISRFTPWDGVELGALALLAVTSVHLWRRVRRPEGRPEAEGLPLVVAAAAVAAVIDEPHRIVGITEVAPDPRPTTAWSLEGRRAHFASHQLR